MNGVFLLCFTVILYNIGDVQNNEIFVLKSPIVCKDDVCVQESHKDEFEIADEEPKPLSQDFVYKNSSKNLVKIKYLDTTVEKNANSYNSSITKQDTETLKNEELFNPSLKQSLSAGIENDTESFSSTDLTESLTESSSTGKNVPETTTNAEDRTSTAFPKLNTSTTQVSSSSEIFFLQNSKKEKGVCFCDLTLNQCDINCCCDGDCSISHFKVFTKCSDASPGYDSNYCFKSNFIFENNTLHKLVQNKGGLFCIIRDNLEFSLNYQTRPIIKTLEDFDKSLPSILYAFSYKNLNKSEFRFEKYEVGSFVWSVQNGELKPFGIAAPSVGLLCVSELHVKYLRDEVAICAYQRNPTECGKPKAWSVFDHLRNTRIISNPASINKSSVLNSSKICQGKTCIGVVTFLCQASEDMSTCVKIQETRSLPILSCLNTVTKIQYHIWHNGSEGIIKFEAYVWLANSSSEEQYLQTTEVKFFWWGSSQKLFRRSGNPGYLTGKPLLAGRIVYYTANETAEKKEAIEMSLDPRDWLSLPGSEKGICSSKLRTSINFRENTQQMCSIKLTKESFGKEKCLELQNTIFKILIGDDIVNATKDNFYNKFVATFGNSRVDEPGDWVQVLIDLFPIISSQTGFRSNYYQLICKNIVTDLYIDVAYANIGSFLTPQSKILGVSYRFGKDRDLVFRCETPDCEGSSVVRHFKLSSFVNFIDLTKPALDAFAEPLTLETRLPHDFFYPFFSDSSSPTRPSTFVLVFCFVRVFL